MFTGIIEEIGKVKQVLKKGDASEISVSVSPDFFNSIKLGDSIAVNGACQTITCLRDGSFIFLSSKQTLQITNLSLLTHGDLVNLERALTLSKGLDGHLVSGHVDGRAKIVEIKKQSEGYLFIFELPEEILNTIVLKGSIAIEGISLTVYHIDKNIITVSVIPYTLQNTNLKNKKNRDTVNIETDLISKYVIRYLDSMMSQGNDVSKPGLTIDFLKDKGFIK